MHLRVNSVWKALPNARVIRVPVDRRGIVDEKEFVAILKSNKVDLVSIMWANNEIGKRFGLPHLFFFFVVFVTCFLKRFRK